LGVEPIFQTGTAARIGLTGYQELLKTLRATKRIGLFKDLENASWTQFQCTMTVRVEFGGQQTEISTAFWNRIAFCNLTNQFAAANFVARVAGQIIRGRIALAEIMHKRCEAHFNIRSTRKAPQLRSTSK
jgi:hypothetical protein